MCNDSNGLLAAIALALALFITACGGGGDSSSDDGGDNNPTDSEVVPTDMSGPPDSIYS